MAVKVHSPCHVRQIARWFEYNTDRLRPNAGLLAHLIYLANLWYLRAFNAPLVSEQPIGDTHGAVFFAGLLLPPPGVLPSTSAIPARIRRLLGAVDRTYGQMDAEELHRLVCQRGGAWYVSRRGLGKEYPDGFVISTNMLHLYPVGLPVPRYIPSVEAYMQEDIQRFRALPKELTILRELE
jgi:uncharacterized phage-associated protein